MFNFRKVLFFLLFVNACSVFGIQVKAFHKTAKVESLSDSIKDVSGEDIVQTALQYLGTRYKAGHSAPGGFDCSGLTSFVYRSNNVPITRSSRTQFQEGTPIVKIENLQKGDLVFFGGSHSSHIVGHVGIVTDVDPDSKTFKFVHAARTGVQIDSYNSAYYSHRYIGARRILEAEE